MNDKSFDTGDPHLRAALMRGLASRRSAMMGAAGVSAAAFLAACGSAGKNPTAGPVGRVRLPPRPRRRRQDMSDTEKLVNWSNWPDYIDVDDKTKARPTLDAFTKQTGIKVNYTEDYNDNDEFYAKVRPLLEAGRTPGATCGAAPTGWWVG